MPSWQLTYRTDYGFAQKQAAATVSTKTATISLGSVEETISGVGTVRSKQSATISWQTSGKVEDVLAEIGQQVEADAVLATLEATSLSTTIIQAQAELISAQNDLEDLQKPSPLKIAEARKALTTAQTGLANLLNPTAEVILAAENTDTKARVLALGTGMSLIDEYMDKRVPRLGEEGRLRLALRVLPVQAGSQGMGVRGEGPEGVQQRLHGQRT